MSWLSDLLQGIPVNPVLKERREFAEQKLREIEQERKELREKVAALEAENADLKRQLADATAQATREKPKMVWGCYVFAGEEDRLYCPACYETKGKKHPTTRINVHERRCTVCQTKLGS